MFNLKRVAKTAETLLRANRMRHAALSGVIDGTKTPEQLLEEAKQKAEAEAKARSLPGLEALLKRLPEGVEAAVNLQVVPAGSKVDTVIVQTAKALDADAIASATHGHSARRHLVAGSTALGMVEKAQLPVILVKSQAVD